jgi:hypothetical protein
MAADAWKIYDGFKEFLGDGTIDLDNDAFKCALHTSASNAATLSTDAFASITNQVSGNGYPAGGAAISTPTWVRATGTMTFDFVDPTFTASGGSIVCRFAVVYDDTVTTPLVDPNVGYSLLDNAPADVTVTDTNTLTIQINANGMFQLTG